MGAPHSKPCPTDNFAKIGSRKRMVDRATDMLCALRESGNSTIVNIYSEKPWW